MSDLFNAKGSMDQSLEEGWGRRFLKMILIRGCMLFEFFLDLIYNRFKKMEFLDTMYNFLD